MSFWLLEKISAFLQSSRRVFVIANKPMWKDFVTMAKVTGIGIIVMAIIGFIITLVFSLLGIGF